jgi:hypothetical protein
MDWATLERHIPYVLDQGAEARRRRATVLYDSTIQALQPGLYWNETSPRGGDFLITLTDAAADWNAKAFTHRDVFADVEAKTATAPEWMRMKFAPAMVLVVAGEQDPDSVQIGNAPPLPGASPRGLLRGAQCLALCEHRRFKQHEPFGGRCLPMRFALGIIYGVWTARMAGDVEKLGKPGLLKLRRDCNGQEPDPVTLVLKRQLKACCQEYKRNSV